MSTHPQTLPKSGGAAESAASSADTPPSANPLSHLQKVGSAAKRSAAFLWKERNWLIILIPYLLACWLPLQYSARNWGNSSSPMAFQILVPIAAAILALRRREKLQSLWRRQQTPSPSGVKRKRTGNMFLLCAGCLILLFGFLVHVDSFYALGLIVIAAGIIYQLYGPVILKALVLPLALLLLIIAPPDSLISKTGEIASRLTAMATSTFLNATGTHATVSGRVITLFDHAQEISDGLGGANLLGATLFLALFYALYTRRSVLYGLCFMTFTAALTVLVHLTRIYLIVKTSSRLPEISALILNTNSWFYIALIAAIALYAAQLFQIVLLRYLVAERRREHLQRQQPSSQTLTGRIDKAIDPVFRASGKKVRRFASQQRKFTKRLDDFLVRLFAGKKKKSRSRHH